MISYSEIEKGTEIIINNQPHEIIEALSVFKGRGHSTMQVRIKNLITGTISSQAIHPSDVFEEADLEKIKVKFIYSSKGSFVFSKENDPSKRFQLTQEQIGSSAKFLKPNQILEGLIFKNEVVNVSLPIKINLKVTEAPPGIKGDRAQGGNKTVILETGAEIAVPLFIEQDDIIEINTEKEEYVRRLEKK